MNAKFKIQGDRWPAGLAVLLLLISAGWDFRQQETIRRIHALPVALHVAPATYQPEACPLPDAASHRWTKPSVGNGLGPPEISADNRAGKSPPTPSGWDGLELQAVQREPFCLQLAGYLGAPGDYRVILTSPNHVENLLVRTGERVPDSPFILESFFPMAAESADPSVGGIRERAARAVVRDQTSGAAVELDSLHLRLTDQLVVSIRSRDGRLVADRLRAGETFVADGGSYRVDRIQLDPPAVVVVNPAVDPPRSITLTLRSNDDRPVQIASAQPDPLPSMSRSPTALPNLATGRPLP